MASSAQGQASSGSNTNPFPSSEHRVRLEKYGIVNSSELEPRDPKPPARHPILQPPAIPGPDIRVVLGAPSGQAVSVRLDPVGSIDAETRTRQGWGVLDAAADPCGTPLPGAISYQSLSVTQSKRDIGMTIRAAAYPGQLGLAPGAQLIECNVYFDPVADRISMKNMASESLKAELLAVGEGEVLPAFVELKQGVAQLLDAGVWAICTSNGQHILNFSVLARQYVSTEPATAAPQGTKRPLESSQSSGPVKKGKAKEAGPGDVATVVFQPVPPQTYNPPARGLTLAPAPATTSAQVVIPLGHPIQNLGPGDMARMIGADGDDYTLTYDRSIAKTRSCSVFTAQHSGLPDKLAVVKVIRSASAVVEPHKGTEAAQGVMRYAELWVEEVRNHSRVSKHDAVVRLFDADSRFLAIYMEHIDAPTLATYRIRNGKNKDICNLGQVEMGQVLRDTSHALMYIHDEGIVHNDIKPSNILYSPHRGAVLIDFGLSTDINSEHLHTGGTPWYVPPEYLRPGLEARRGTPGDVFALGVVMLFVARKLPLPETCRIHHPEWRINEARLAPSPARAAMNRWLAVVDEASASLDIADTVSRKIQRMTISDPERRTPAAELASE